MPELRLSRRVGPHVVLLRRAVMYVNGQTCTFAYGDSPQSLDNLTVSGQQFTYTYS